MARTANAVLPLYRSGAYEAPDPFGGASLDDVPEVEVAASRRTPRAQLTPGSDGVRMRVFSRRPQRVPHGAGVQAPDAVHDRTRNPTGQRSAA
ncbi:hypothetical protein rosag_09270 [Roseisolibacter agri]|uniref:Uncharacterized protein n=1 Tax=Roseisolibacter agri TaxID=2014610 RepID=A0AA37Q116_9BACT|nr:hypothetical protein rosag_09270 [Roseisolibacter agri]